MIVAMRNCIFVAVLACLVLGGCATGGSSTRVSGEPFELAQTSGRITGQVCGMDVDLDVKRAGDGVALSGFLDGKFPVHLTARDEAGGGRAIAGGLGTQAGDAAVDLHVRADKLDGHVGFRRFDLRADGDKLAGTMQIAGAIEPSDAELDGRAQLASLPLDTQAALLPSLLTCNVQRIGRWGRSSLLVRVGGPAGALPHESSSVYTKD
jgi:hypothetical protein